MNLRRNYLSLLLMLFVAFICGCKGEGKLQAERRLADTIKELTRRADFRPLNQDEAYSFLNKYYLPGLDTLPTKRKIFIYPLAGTNFKKMLKRDIEKLTAEFDHEPVRNESIYLDPPDFPLDSNYKWDSKKLINTVVVNDDSPKLGKSKLSVVVWHKKFGYGYMVVSYPMYNLNTKILQILQWDENFSSCGTGRDSRFFYKKTPGGWQKL
jgi:hypothetical protein